MVETPTELTAPSRAAIKQWMKAHIEPVSFKAMLDNENPPALLRKTTLSFRENVHLLKGYMHNYQSQSMTRLIQRGGMSHEELISPDFISNISAKPSANGGYARAALEAETGFFTLTEAEFEALKGSRRNIQAAAGSPLRLLNSRPDELAHCNFATFQQIAHEVQSELAAEMGLSDHLLSEARKPLIASQFLNKGSVPPTPRPTASAEPPRVKPTPPTTRKPILGAVVFGTPTSNGKVQGVGAGAFAELNDQTSGLIHDVKHKMFDFGEYFAPSNAAKLKEPFYAATPCAINDKKGLLIQRSRRAAKAISV
jgi:hypothetical protein